jgi:hypothetical protein
MATGVTSTPSTEPPTTTRSVIGRDGFSLPTSSPLTSPGTTAERRLWVITDDLEDPDTATTLLRPSDY